jgi:hypothetical protein
LVLRSSGCLFGTIKKTDDHRYGYSSKKTSDARMANSFVMHCLMINFRNIESAINIPRPAK